MGRRALALAVILTFAPGSAAAAGPRGNSERRAAAARERRRTPQPARHPRPLPLADAKAAMTALMRDRVRRRFHHQWDRAIAGLLRAARGKDAPAAYFEAARARYALYRWSANEADREEALRLAAKATERGSADAGVLSRAIRREAGEEHPTPPASRRPRPAGPAVAERRGDGPAAAHPEIADDDSPADPTLEAALADLSPSAAPGFGSGGGERRARISEVRTWASEEYTRVAVYLSRWVGWQKLELPSGPGRPRRVAIDFRPAALAGAALARSVAGEQVERVRAAQNDSETVRVVLELPGGDGVQLFALDDPPRLVADVGGHPTARREAVRPASSPPSSSATAAHGARSAPDSSPEPSDTPMASVLSASKQPVADAKHDAGAAGRDAGPTASEDASEGVSSAIRRIVVDAGHGGHDPGAIGPRHVREKDVTLAMARRLAKKLREEGFQVVLTRKDDRFLALEERTAIANTARGDLFVSIHANAHPRRNRAGIETYFLNTTDDRYAARLAARENGLDLGEGETDVDRILTDLDAKTSASTSQALARIVQREVTSGVRARVGEVRDLGVKSALFYVLLGARMPAVLIETAFISNRDEERRLASSRYQDEVATGIARAISSFARRGQRLASAR